MAAKKKAAVADSEEPSKKAKSTKKTPQYISMTTEALQSAALAIQDSLRELVASHKKTPLTFATLADIKSSYVPLHNIYLEHLWGTRGLPEHTLGEIIGPEGIGKTTLAFYLIGKALRNGCPALYLATEGKPMLPERVKRNFSFIRKEADQMLKSVTAAEVFTLASMAEHIEAWADHVRNTVKLPRNVPGIIVVDTWSKLMSDAEAMGYYEDDPEYMDA